MKILVTGGRDYADRERVYSTLDQVVRTISTVTGADLLIHGACPYGGADILAEDWAKAREIPYLGMPAKFHSAAGKAAGPQRNQRMVNMLGDGDNVVVFPGGRGTANCANLAKARARKFNIDIWYPEGEPNGS